MQRRDRSDKPNKDFTVIDIFKIMKPGVVYTVKKLAKKINQPECIAAGVIRSAEFGGFVQKIPDKKSTEKKYKLHEKYYQEASKDS